MEGQFDSCSYRELTLCTKNRINSVRERRRFIEDPISKDYANIRVEAAFKNGIELREIRRLLKMRRILKSSGRKNWDSNYFGDV